jgi:hypothetical protein
MFTGNLAKQTSLRGAKRRSNPFFMAIMDCRVATLLAINDKEHTRLNSKENKLMRNPFIISPVSLLT